MNIKDGYALQLAVKKGYRVVIISGGKDDAVKLRLDKLGIKDCFLNVDNKKETSIKLFLHTTSDFEMELLSLGDKVKIISPGRLRKRMREIYKNALAKNKD